MLKKNHKYIALEQEEDVCLHFGYSVHEMYFSPVIHWVRLNNPLTLCFWVKQYSFILLAPSVSKETDRISKIPC